MRLRREHGDLALVGAPPVSFAHVYDAHVDEVYRYIHRRCQDHTLAEDITQDTFIAAIRATDDPNTITIGWLITVARNRLFDVLRRKTNYEEKLRLVADNARSVDQIDIAERLRVEAAMERLPVHYRLVLTLHYINGLTVGAIADELDRSVKSIEGLVTRARKELTAVLDETDGQLIEGGES